MHCGQISLRLGFLPSSCVLPESRSFQVQDLAKDFCSPTFVKVQVGDAELQANPNVEQVSFENMMHPLHILLFYIE